MNKGFSLMVNGVLVVATGFETFSAEVKKPHIETEGPQLPIRALNLNFAASTTSMTTVQAGFSMHGITE